MEELLIAALQFLIEFFFNVLSNAPFDWPSKNRRSPEPESSVGKNFVWFLGGCLLAGITLLFFKQPLISLPELRIANLLLAPIAAAFFSQYIARERARTNPFIVPRNHFWQAFWYTVGLVLIRFAYATRT